MQKKHTPSEFNIRKKLGYLKPHSLAKKIGLSTRKYRKCSVVDLVFGHWQLISIRQYSYDNWATQISSITGRIISGQAICKRMCDETILFLSELLNKSMAQKCDSILTGELFSHFNEVLIQDATHFSLPRCLSNIFPGSYSDYGASATAKVQATYSVRKGVFNDLFLCNFRDNDQKDSSRVLPLLNTDDLIIRDLGYFVLATFDQIASKGAFYLSRFKYNLNIYKEEGNTKLDLIKTLKKKQYLDIDVLVGEKKKLKCRLVAQKLPDAIASERRRKAKNDRSKKANHSKDYYLLLGYSIYITNVSREVWTPNNIVQAYKARWYIEILFKGWKSNLKMKVNIPQQHMTKLRAEFYLYSTLLYINLLIMPMYHCEQHARKENKTHISILKLCSIINQNIQAIINAWIPNISKMINYYCTYEKRNHRINAMETICFTNH